MITTWRYVPVFRFFCQLKTFVYLVSFFLKSRSRQTPSEATEAEKTVDDTGSVVSPGLATTSVGEDTGLADEATLLLERQTGNCWMEESAFKSSHSIACEDQLPGADAQPAQVVSLCNFVFLQSDATENLIVGQASKSGTNTLSSPQMSSRVTQSVEKPLTPSVVLDAQATDHSNDSPSNGLQCSASHSECFIPASVVTSTPLPETTSYSTGKTISVCQEKSTINTSLNSGHGKCETISSEPEHAESKVKQSSGVEKLRPFSSKLKPSTQTKEVESKNASDNSHSVLKKTVGNKNVRPKGSVLVKSCKTAEGGSPCRKENLNNNDLSETKKKYQPADAKWIKDLIDSTSTDNTDSEELTNIPLSMAFTSRMPENVQPRKDENPVIPVGKTEKCCKGDAMDMLGHVSCVSDQARGPEKLNLLSKKPIEMSSECRNEVKSGEKSLAKLYYSCVPARSSAKKAMSKMKSTLVSDVESDEKCSPEKMTMKALPIKGNIEKPRVGIKINMKSLTQSSLHPKTSASNLSGLTSSISSFHAHKRKTTYMCQYCVDVNPGSLRKIKAHVLLKHKSMPPTVVNCRGQRRHKNCQFYVCSQPACFKLFNSEKDLETHKNSCPHEPHVSNTRPKERTTFNSSCCNVANTASFKDHDSVNVKSDVLLMNQPKVPVKSPSAANLPSPVSVPPIRACRVELHMLDASMVEARSLIHKRDGKYQCLYCTDYVYENTLAAMKSHYIQEHEGQLMVMRDTEARRAQQPSRIYVCSSPGCEHSCVSRNDLDNHLRSEHSASSCSYVYQCAVCGWFSSSHAVAIQHVQAQHSPSEGASLVRMQVMVDEQGQTSKKIV
ncbi:hypothetical protein PoB_003122500 [Plakobranchus ocellatus]|uniref:C2H2-type domain-containing protein n=1 Tax=Plakobranchus ocellatus TaxID=259542 RepID=A0AAV4A980_9GAST|nr:hypothetical protein PoB_003122500 [Plakobranchus ocellatus]